MCVLLHFRTCDVRAELLLDSPFKMRFWYRLRYRAKVSANLSFGFGIGPKPQ
jgi:hypothetical protein